MKIKPEKILITGPESTGKSTIAAFIGEHYGGVVIKEHARYYLEINGPGYEYDDLLTIAKEHAIIAHTAFNQNKLIICDTYMLNLKIWAEYKYGKCPAFIKEELDRQSFDLIFLTTPDVCWRFDPFRENKDNRDELYCIFIQELELMGLDYMTMKADRKQRELQVVELIESFNSEK